MKFLIVIVGPTAVGKTQLCIDLATDLGTEILSADSRQFFREMSIGTAKPTEEELQAVTHHFINSHSVQEAFNAGDFEREALKKMEDLFNKHDHLIMTGGSGLYINAVTDGMADIPAVKPEIRDELNRRLTKEGLEVLVKELKILDPEYYEQVDINNPHRVTRALEVCIGTGEKYSELRKKQKKEPRNFHVLKIGLRRDREELYERINQRVDMMIEEGLYNEVKELYPYKEHSALQTVGYTEIFNYIDGQYDWEEAVRLLKRNTRRYAKRQLTWFGKDEDIEWFHPDDYLHILEYIRSKTQGK